ncbi:unnamed protein product [Euphydryas editha]|uniref:MADF domain-containing protein n=1 Tax=Euphydryas editha TaxID=104508 RepID=A0AAU9UHA8_EUPED|nr:unnamed protein product [Euphydryas editha]
MEQLIESVRKYPCLWKIDCKEYKLNDLKDAAWKEVLKECDLKDGKEARALWKKLRDGHRQALAKKKNVTGQAATSKYKWKYEQHMEFLLPSMQNRPRSTNVIIEEHSSGDSTIQNEESVNDSVVEQIYVDVNPPKKKATLVSLLETEQRRRQDRSIERDTLRKQILLSSAAKPETALEKFFNSMLLTTQTLSERLQIKVQREIFNIVMEAKEEHLASQPTCSTQLAPSHPGHGVLVGGGVIQQPPTHHLLTQNSILGGSDILGLSSPVLGGMLHAHPALRGVKPAAVHALATQDNSHKKGQWSQNRALSSGAGGAGGVASGRKRPLLGARAAMSPTKRAVMTLLARARAATHKHAPWPAPEHTALLPLIRDDFVTGVGVNINLA